MKIKTFLTFVFGFFATVAVIAFAVVSSYSLSGEIEKNYVNIVNEQAKKQSANTELYIGSVTAGFKALADDIQKSDNREDYAKKYVLNRKDIIGIAVLGNGSFTVNGEGQEFALNVTDSAVEYEDGKVYIYAREEKKPSDSFGLLIKTALSGGDTLYVAYTGDGVKSIVGSAYFPVGGRLVLIDPNKNVVDDSLYLGELSTLKTASLKAAEYAQIEKVAASNSPTSLKYKAGKNEYEAGMEKIGESGWFAISVGNISAAQKEASDSTGAILIVVIIVCIAGLVMTGVTVSIFTKPLNVISRTILQIRRGDHDARIRVMARNEYGEVARLFNDLIDDIVVGEARYRTIIEMSDNVIFEWNLKNNEVFFSNNFNKKFSYRAPSDHFTDSFLIKCKVHPDDAVRYRQDLETLGKGAEFKRNEYRFKNIYGDWVWFLIRTASVKDENGEPFKIIGVMVDIDRAKKTEENLSSRASYDALTNVYNRDSIESLIENEIELLAVRKDQFAVLFVDIDDFKDFNDKFSHATGDQVLKFTSQTLGNIVQGFGMVGRYGGDEFVVCVKNSEVNNPEKIAQEILARLKEGYTADTGDHLSIDASIGVIVVRDPSKRIELVVGAADDAMYKIKKSGKSNYTIIDEQ